MLDWARAQFPAAPIGLVGHSIGGQLVGMLDDFTGIDTVCTVAAQHGYWRRYPLGQALQFWLLWTVIVPIVTALWGYFPTKKLKLGEDLPTGVARGWARSCKSKHYLVDGRGRPIRRGFEAFTGHVRAYCLADDRIAPRGQVAAYHAYYQRAEVELVELAPATYQQRAIGHIGFFAPKLKATLWREHAAWWAARSAAAAAA